MSIIELREGCLINDKDKKEFITSNRLEFSKYASFYDDHAILQASSGDCLLSELKEYINKNNDFKFNKVIDLGSGTGANCNKLFELTNCTEIFEIDHSNKMLEISKAKNSLKNRLFCCADMHNLPFSKKFKADLIFSNLSFQWCLDLKKLFVESSDFLNKNGVMAFSTILDGSLSEISRNFSINNFLTKEEFCSQVSNISGLSLYDFKFKKIICKFDSLFDLFASIFDNFISNACIV